MSDAFQNLMKEHRRLAILRALESPKSGGECNDSILQSVVISTGIASSRDQIRSALEWMEEQDLVTVRTLESGTMVATITQRGLDVASGLLTVSGVQRRSPGK